MRRAFDFYCEFIILTILALVAGNIWVRWSNNIIDSSDFSTKILFILGVFFTVLAVFMMMTLFGEKTKMKTHAKEMFDRHYDQ